ncbi:nuclear transport factor 2 family protein [Sphingomonas sp. CROZ-RG-20F-R02-07]|uniref:nuclear transport factor 2 family protein n=1 Tax=Sphingomonas sp. CROZ-RG-20F-R02-07 TaxID=2914832 RepID=UPI001F56D2E7|nr:nuclear transport factor 2 family protein [Sphingomonas sp. CROZ-RG-20F-R02-07]
MIIPQRWAEKWVAAWNARDLDGLMAMYADDVQLRSPFAKLYATDGVIRGKAELRAYWGEVIRRLPKLDLQLVRVYSGHLTLAFHYRDDSGRDVIETVLFNVADLAVSETACIDKPRVGAA